MRIDDALVGDTENKVNTTSTPDEQAGFQMQAKLKIFDPESEEIFIEQRG